MRFGFQPYRLYLTFFLGAERYNCKQSCTKNYSPYSHFLFYCNINSFGTSTNGMTVSFEPDVVNVQFPGTVVPVCHGDKTSLASVSGAEEDVIVRAVDRIAEVLWFAPETIALQFAPEDVIASHVIMTL